MSRNQINPWCSERRPQSTTETGVIFQRATLVNKRPPHTSATPFLASLRLPALYQPHFGTNRSEQTGLPSWKVAWSYILNFRVTAIQSRSNFPWIFLGFSNAHQTVIHTEMKLLKTYLVAEARVCEFGLFGG